MSHFVDSHSLQLSLSMSYFFKHLCTILLWSTILILKDLFLFPVDSPSFHFLCV